MRVLVGLAIGVCLFLVHAHYAVGEVSDNVNRYIGSAACRECHEHEYENFTKYAKKAKKPNSVQIMMSDLDDDEVVECYGCHTTGYGEPGGFVSFEQTPEMGHAGCEVCHGPGEQHVENGGDPELIKRSLTLRDCEACHRSERVRSFNYKPLLHGGAH